MSTPSYSLQNAAQAGASIISHSMTNAQLGGMVNQMFSSEYNNYKSQQTQAALYNQALQAGLAKNQHKYMINGRTMTWDQWLDELAPGEDNPQRTFLILKYKDNK